MTAIQTKKHSVTNGPSLALELNNKGRPKIATPRGERSEAHNNLRLIFGGGEGACGLGCSGNSSSIT